MKKTVILFIGIFFLSFSCFAQSESENINVQTGEAEEISTLEAPVNFLATALDDQSVTLTWDDICEIETGFIIERKGGGEGFSEIASLDVNSTSFIDKGLTFGVKYTYRICSYNQQEKSDYSKKVSVKTIFPQPLDLAVEIIDDQSVKLTWVENCAFEEGFIVERKKKGTEFQEIGRTEKDGIEFTDEDLLYRNKYTYRICGFTALNKSDYSEKTVAKTVFPIPANFKVRALDDQSVRLSWEDRCDFEKGFIIERKVKKEEFSNIVELTENTTYFDDKGLTDGKGYYYRIKAFSQLNESDYSSEISISTSFPAPQNLYVDILNDHSCKLYWEDKSSFVTGFIVERKENEGEFEQIAELGGITKNYVDETMVLGSNYSYRIRALSEKNTSAYSNEISTKTDFPGPANLYSETIDDQSLRLYWEDNSTFEEGFKLERKDEDSDYVEISLLEPNTTTFIDKNLKYGRTYIYRVAAYTITSTTGYSNEHSAKTIFPKPSYLSALVLDDQSIKLSWLDNCNFDEGFKLERKEDSGEFRSIASLDTETTSYLDENLHYGTNYIYRVFAVTKLNNSDYSNKVEVKTFFPEPTYLSSEVINDQTISLYWEDNCSFEAGFRLERKMDSKAFSEIAVFGENITTHIDKDLSFGKTYYYRVLAFTSFNESDYSNVEYASTIFAKPTNLTAKIIGAEEIDLTWSDNCYFENGYSIERSVGGSDFKEIGRTSSNIKEYKDLDLAFGADYTYRVRAYTKLNYSDYSKTVTRSLGICAPTSLKTRIIGDRQIKLTWTDNTNIEDGFKIERRTSEQEFEFYAKISANVTSYIDTDTEIHVNYYYRIFSYSKGNKSHYSNEVHAICHYGELRVPEDYFSIQSAIDASTSGDIVLVQPGTYKENLNFNGKNITIGSLYLTTGNAKYIDDTILDGDKENSVVIFENEEKKNTRLIGFTIINGIGNALRGGGIFIYNSSPTLKNLVITGNTADEFGGGIYLYNSNPVMEDLTISSNTSSGTLYGYGGGVYLNNSNPQMTRITITDNTCTEFGGGIYIYNSNPELRNCMITFNKVKGNKYGFGGAVYTQYARPILSSLTIYGNEARQGGAIFCNSFSNPKLLNSILWQNKPQEICFHKFGDIKITIGYTDLEGAEEGILTNNNGSIFFQMGFINVDPKFENPAFKNFHLKEGSDCIDAGNPAVEYNDIDGSINDLGAYGGARGNWK